MKTHFKCICLLTSSALFSLFTLNSLSAVETEPVGYVTVNLVGDSTNLLSNSGLVQATASAGSGDISGGNTFTATGASWQNDEFASTHYLQLTASGAWSPIISNNTSSLTLEFALSDQTNADYTIRPLNTLNILFGNDNSAGFTSNDSLGASDIIAVWDQPSQSLAGLYYYNSVSNEWQDANNLPAGSTIIYPDETMVVFTKSAKSITFTGNVQTGATSGQIAGGGKTSLVPNPYPTDLKIAMSGLENSIEGGPDFGASDKVLIWDASTSGFSHLYYYDTDLGEEGWKNALNEPVTDADVIPAGSCAVVFKSGSDAQWVTNQPF